MNWTDLHFELGQNAPVVGCFAFLFGAVTGSFLNVLALRSLKEESILWPPSYCPHCRHALSVVDNLPIVSWFMLQGKCRYCREPVSMQYPLVELLTGAVFVAIVHLFLLSPVPYVELESHNLFQEIARGIESGPQSHALNDWRVFALTGGMLVFACTLIAVTVTDLKEKLIPHEITYPSMLFGIAFSAVVRQDLLGAMAGIGASYIIFDFLAFYGLKVYLKMHPQEDEAQIQPGGQPAMPIEPGGTAEQNIARTSADEDAREETASLVAQSSQDDSDQVGKEGGTIGDAAGSHRDSETTAPVDSQQTPAKSATLSAAADSDQALAEGEALPPAASNATALPNDSGHSEAKEEDEPIEVMGGGDAVLSAVMAAYLGWQLLVVALCVGFLAGTLAGLVLLFQEMKKAALLKQCFKTSIKFAVIAAASLSCLMVLLLTALAGGENVSGFEFWQPVLTMSILGGVGGAVMGIVTVGTQVSKPLPFAPALAFGGFVAMFLIPQWLPFY